METSAKNATNVEQAFMAMTAAIKNKWVACRSKISLSVVCTSKLLMNVLCMHGCRMASQPGMNGARPPTVQIRGQPVNQKTTCCSS